MPPSPASAPFTAAPAPAPLASGDTPPTSGPDGTDETRHGATVWRRADDDVWAATSHGEHAGTIVRTPDGYRVSDRLSRPVGLAPGWPQAVALHAGATTATSGRSTSAPPIRPRRQRRDELGRRRGQAHRTREDIMATGTVKWFNAEKGFGFIAPSDGSADVFAHYSAIATSGYRSLEENQNVEFDVTQGPKGPQASNIRPL